MKKALSLIILFTTLSCAELPGIIGGLPGTPGMDTATMGAGLRQALDFGINKEVTKLAQADGFFKNDLVKILLPQELQKVDKTLRDIGLGSMADEGLKLLNRAAEEAVGEALPIFVDAVKGITFNDAKNILLGGQDAATQFLKSGTQQALYSSFSPIISNKLDEVGANRVWENIINKYNSVPFTNNVNPNLTDYVTGEALNGVYTMIAVEEKQIRTNLESRTTDLLRRVFEYADNN